MTTATAPASSANLGPGFDVAALALGLRCTVTAEPHSEWVVTTAGEPAGVDTIRMVRAVAGDVAPFDVEIESEIPEARGLGSSAALLVATHVAVTGDPDPERAFAAAFAVEGHPDNVAAAVHGGLQLVGPGGTLHRGTVHPSFSVVVAVPDQRLPTVEARAALDATIDRSVAVRTAARFGLLLEGLRTGDRDALRAALGDEIHEAPRRRLTDLPGALIDTALAAGAAYASWSGAGPSVIAFAGDDDVDAVVEAFEQIVEGEVFELEIDREGLRIE